MTTASNKADRLAHLQHLARQDWPAAERFSKRDMLCALDRVVELEEALEEEDARADTYAGVCLSVMAKIFKSGAWRPGPNDTLLDELQDGVRTILEEREQRLADVRGLCDAIRRMQDVDELMPRTVPEYFQEALAKVRTWCGEEEK